MAVSVPPVQVVEAAGAGATTTPAGRLSVNDRPVAASALALLSMVKVRVLTPVSGTTAGANALANAGGGSTARVSVAGSPTDSPEAFNALVVFG